MPTDLDDQLMELPAGVVAGAGGSATFDLPADGLHDVQASATWLPMPLGQFRPILRMDELAEAAVLADLDQLLASTPVDSGLCSAI